MILKKAYAMRLLRAGKAQHEGYVEEDGVTYGIITRCDKQRTDHYEEG